MSPDQIDDGKSYPEDSIKPLEKKALNFLVNQYLLQINNKLTSVTFSEENEEQVPSPTVDSEIFARILFPRIALKDKLVI